MVNDSTRGYSVNISDTENTVSGSGVLFYDGGNSLFVFTCAHVVDDLDSVRVYLLKEMDASRDLYRVFCIDVPASQIVISPLDKVTIDPGGEKIHSEDLAIIQAAKPLELDLSLTEYIVAETRRDNQVYIQGFPDGVPKEKNLIECLDCLKGHVVVNSASSSNFVIRLDELALNNSNRVCELQGLSGSPVWSDNEEDNELLGLLTSAYGTDALLGKTYAAKSHRIRTIMYDLFKVAIERKLDGIPEEDIAGTTSMKPVVYDGTISPFSESNDEEWIKEQLTALHAIIEDLKLQKAIDKGKEIISNPKYLSVSKDSQKKAKQYLLYCYEIADLDDEFEALEADMRDSGLIKAHDNLRQLTRSFMKRNFQETIEAAQAYIQDFDGSGSVSMLSIAKAFLALARAYTLDLPVDQTIGQLIDEQENFILPTDEIEDTALIYQMIGYVYGEKYHDHVNSVRFLNRSYRIGFDSIVLESLGAAYYNLGVYEATDENGKIPDVRKIDRKSLYKARECFLFVIGKADELFWKGSMLRVGMCVYNTMVFLQDNYRILSLYPNVLEYVIPNKEVDEDDFWRDVEMKQARIIAQSGTIKTSDYPHIRRIDRILLESMAETAKCENILEHAAVEPPPKEIKWRIEEYLKGVIQDTESVVRQIDKPLRLALYISLLNMYGRGMRLFGWHKHDKLLYCLERIRRFGDSELIESAENYIFEFEAPLDDVILRFRATFENRRNLGTWQELNRLYIRHGMMDMADEMYKQLLAERKELISDEPEYAYRAFIDYVIMYRRDLKYALKCYVDAKKAFQDTDIEGFWELELMVHANIFNDPERFESERRPFLERGLITEEQYHRTAFIAYLTNLDEEKAREHNEYIRQYPHLVHPVTNMLLLNLEEIHYLNWIGEIQPNFSPPSFSMTESRASEIRVRYRNESWHRVIDSQMRHQFTTDKTVAIDAWGLYQLVEFRELDILGELDNVFVSHQSIIRLHEELSRTNNQKIRELQKFLRDCDRVKIWSAGFETQIEVRNVAEYTEAASCIAGGIEKDCLVVLGEPEVNADLREHFGNRIVRVNDFRVMCGCDEGC